MQQKANLIHNEDDHVVAISGQWREVAGRDTEKFWGADNIPLPDLHGGLFVL